ncbi:DNA repair protein RecN [Oleidesulfovibrio sp.]|uniref:DNA repair protein RecN n=1 Tax=Oleidesulfovibrio sp. TaxID=2909707 RepID=UPI003A85D625
MLELLRIRNLALIEDMELEFAPGMNVLTGETGAGKSFILKALNFLTGDKLSAEIVRAGKDKATVEALFAMPDGDLIIRRELTADTGRSRLYINDKLSSQETVRDLRSSLIVHTSQHGQQKLLQPAFQAKLLDRYMNRPDLLEERDSLLKKLRQLAETREELLERSKSLSERRELLEFQQQEIAKVDPQPDEEGELLERKRILSGQTKSRELVDEAISILGDYDGGVIPALGNLETMLKQLAVIMPDYEEDATALSDFRQVMHDLEGRLRRQPVYDSDEEGLEEIEARLYQLAQLKRKLKRSLEEIVDLQHEIEENLSFLDSCELDLKQLARQEDDERKKLAALLAKLNPARREAGERLTAEIVQELKGIGFSEQVQVRFTYTPHKLAEGCEEERASMLWLPNPGQPPQPLDKIASGGELSRFLLAVVGLLSRDEAATLIFDEVDSGVGGLTLNSVAQRLQKLASDRQMLLITHWPQLAAKAERHFHVRKEVSDDTTYTYCQPLDSRGISEELSRMAGGGQQGDAFAGELLTPVPSGR